MQLSVLLYRQYFIEKCFCNSIYNSITQRIANYNGIYGYYIFHHTFMKPKICDQLYCWIRHLPNPYKFDYSMDPDKRENYQFPLLFSQAGLCVRAGSSIRNTVL